MEIEMKVVGRFQDFTLFDRPEKANAGWKSLKLVRDGTGHPKRNWWLGWNGERLAAGRDQKLLAEHLPAIEEWVVQALLSADCVTP